MPGQRYPLRTVWPVAACVLLASCTVKSDEKEILPWLKQRSTYEAFFPSGLFIAYYDELGKPWMLIESAKARDYRYMPRECALVTYGEGAPVIVAGPAEMTDEECRSKSAWEKIAGRPLQDAHPRLPSHPVRAW